MTRHRTGWLDAHDFLARHERAVDKERERIEHVGFWTAVVEGRI